jgi:hypothetical protein
MAVGARPELRLRSVAGRGLVAVGAKFAWQSVKVAICALDLQLRVESRRGKYGLRVR